MDYSEQKQYFETAYRTGSDIWTDKHYHHKMFSYISEFPTNSLVLDIGTGRGRWPFAMAETGLRVIGLDYVKSLAEVGNHEAKAKHLEGKLRFVHGDALDINFTDESFDAVTDFGLLQHLSKSDWPAYIREVSRVLKPGGYYLSVALSKETEHFYTFEPKKSQKSDFEKYGVSYHFFADGEIAQTLGSGFRTVKSETIYVEKHQEYLIVTLLQKLL